METADRLGASALTRTEWQAAVGDKVDVVELLIAKGANVRSRSGASVCGIGREGDE